jgi:signal transduction histidine kinase
MEMIEKESPLGYKKTIFKIIRGYNFFISLGKKMQTGQEIQKQLNEVLKETNAELAERNKELKCLYGISKINEEASYSLNETLQRIVNILPLAWQQPDNTCARIVLENHEFKTDNFTETEWQQTCDLLVKGYYAGAVEIFRIGFENREDESPFLNGEQSLLEAVAERLGKIIERRRAAEALQKSEERFKNLVENSIAGISIVQENQIIYQNKVQEKLLGPLPRTYVLGDYKNIHPDDVEMVMKANRDIQMGKIPKLDLDFRLIPAGDTRDDHAIKRVFCRVLLIEYYGKEAILVNMIDMTKIMQLEELLFRQDKMASLGRIAAGLAHQIRNPLSGINIYLNALEKMVDKPDNRPKVDQIIAQLKSASKKIESVIKNVMDFAKPGEPSLELIQINKPIKDVLKLSAVTLRKSGIEIEKDLDEKIPPCYADSHLIEEAMLNLLNNAAEAMRELETGKKIVVSSGVTRDHIFIKVSDSGPGVPVELRSKIFDPYFTTKNDGTGIGLNICHRIADDHKGILIIDESPTGGAEFRIEIPIRKEVLSID